GVQRGRNDHARGAARVEASIACGSALDDFAQRGGELARLFRADEARERLLQHFIGAVAEQFVDRVVGGEDFAFQVGDEDWIGRVLDQTIRIERARVRRSERSEQVGGASCVASKGACYE